MLYPLGAGEPRPIPGLEKGDQPIRFSGDGRLLFVRLASGDRASVTIVLLDVGKGRKQPWKVLGPADPAVVMEIFQAFPAPDSRAHLYNYFRLSSELFLVTF